MKMWPKVLLAAICAAPSLAQPAEGKSLYKEDSFRSLTADARAHKVGDLLTVLVYENASASSTADTSTGRDANVGVTLDLPLPHTSRYKGTHTASAQTGNTFRGQGQTERSGQIVAQLTVPVIDVLNNGDLVLAGTQELDINGERQTIHIEGRVRAVDVSDANTVLSTRIADAQISVAGDGTLNDQQKPGWWQRLLTWFGI
jgi:flagellar L-ring protein precursor FlgH